MKRFSALILVLSLLAALALPAISSTSTALAQTDGSVVSDQQAQEPADPTEPPPPPSETPVPSDTPVPPPTDTSVPIPTDTAPAESTSTATEEVIPASTEETTTPISTPYKNLHIGDLVDANTRVNCRIGPSTGTTILKVLEFEDQAVVIAEPQRLGDFDWVQLQLFDALTTQCYTAAQFLDLVEPGYGVPPTSTAQPSFTPTRTRTATPVATPYKNLHSGDLVRATTVVNCRAGATIAASVVTELSSGAQAVVIGEPSRVGQFDWVPLQLLDARTTRCYSAGQYLTLVQAGYGIPATITATATITLTPTRTPAQTHTPSATPTETATPSNTPTPSDTPTVTETPTASQTPTVTETPTETLTPTQTQTSTQTATSTPTGSATATLTPTFKNLHAGDLTAANQSVNCRASNSDSSAVMRVLEKNERAVLLTDPALANGAQWVKVRPFGTTIECFVDANYLVLVAPGYGLTPTATVSSTVIAAGPYNVGDVIQSTTALNVRTDAGTNNPITQTVGANTKGSVMTGYKKVGADDWVQVQFPSGNGWVAARYTALVTSNAPGGPFAAGEKIVVIAAVNLRTAPGTSNPSLGVLEVGQAGIAFGQKATVAGATWVQVEFSIGAGWLSSQYVKKLTAVTPTIAPSASNVWVYLDCTSNPERVIVQNNNPSSIRILSIGSTYQPGSGEPFDVGDTLGSGITLSYESNSNASGEFRLTSSEIFNNNVGSQEGVVVKTSLGDVTASCPTAVTGEKWIEVNLSTQTLTAWRGSTRISSSLVSSGKPGFETPTGTFYISVKYESVTMSGCAGGECWTVPAVPWAMLFRDGGYFIHGAYWHNDFGRLRLSHGCVNLPVPYAEWLYGWAPSGTRVWIHY